MKASTVVPAPGSGTEAEALIKEARRRQRRRYAVTGLAVAAVLAGALVAFAGRPGASHPPPVIRTITSNWSSAPSVTNGSLMSCW